MKPEGIAPLSASLKKEMGITLICAIFFAVLFNVIILDDDSAAQHLRATLAGLTVGACIGYFVNWKFNKRLRD